MMKVDKPSTDFVLKNMFAGLVESFTTACKKCTFLGC